MSLDDTSGPNQRNPIDLYDLLPAFNRIKDAERGYRLKALLDIISDQANIIYNDIVGLWDDFFIETCKPWVIPYIADLVANNPLNDVAASRRTDVAKTIYYRRRKGTLSMLEELAKDVTGWGAHVVPFFELLGWTQNLNHLRYSVTTDPVQLKPIQDPFAMDRVGSVNLRNRSALDILNGPFDIITHTVDVRTISRWEGWYNIRRIGFFLWRLRSYPMICVNPRKSSSSNSEFRFHFSPIGNPSPLFNRPEEELGENGLCNEINIPGPIRPLAFYFNKGDYYAPVDAEDCGKSEKSIAICCGSDINSAKLVPIDRVVCKDLSNWGPPPQDMTAAVDLRLGRITFAKDPGEVSVCYSYGFSADIGGGPYERRNSLADEEKYEWEITVCKHIDPSDKTTKCSASTLEQALVYWADPDEEKGKGNKRSAIIKIADSSTYEEAITNIEIPEGKSLVIQAANQMRPHIRLIGNDNLPGIPKIEGSTGSELILNGLLIEGGIYLNENIEYVTIEHCTLVPGWSLGEDGKPLHPDIPSISVHKDNLKLSIEIDHCITGALNLPSGMVCLTVKDSIVDACNQDTTDPATSTSSDERYAISFAESIPPSNTNISLPLKGWGNLEVTGSLDDSYFVKYTGGSLHELSANKGFEDGKYRKILTNSNKTRHFSRSDEISDNLKLEEGYELSLKSIQGNEITLELFKNGQSVDTKDLLLETDSTQAQTTYYYSSNPDGSEAGSSEKTVTIAVHIQGIESKDKTIIVDVDGVLQISEVPTISIPVAHSPGPSTKLESVTIFGPVHVKELALASETIFMAPVVAERRPTGCVRFSYLPEGSKTPRRYRCQPDLALERKAKDIERSLINTEREETKEQMKPSFTSTHYGDPGYAQLGLVCATEIRTGAEDGSEMGAFCSLKQPQREDNLRIRLEEYLPFGLKAGFIYVT